MNLAGSGENFNSMGFSGAGSGAGVGTGDGVRAGAGVGAGTGVGTGAGVGAGVHAPRTAKLTKKIITIMNILRINSNLLQIVRKLKWHQPPPSKRLQCHHSIISLHPPNKFCF